MHWLGLHVDSLMQSKLIWNFPGGYQENRFRHRLPSFPLRLLLHPLNYFGPTFAPDLYFKDKIE